MGGAAGVRAVGGGILGAALTAKAVPSAAAAAKGAARPVPAAAQAAGSGPGPGPGEEGMLFQRRAQPGPAAEAGGEGGEQGSGERRRIHSARPLNVEIQVGCCGRSGGRLARASSCAVLCCAGSALCVWIDGVVSATALPCRAGMHS